ncbi:MAG: hypothetical protein ACYC35_25350 [Pirellulales bacterium]
MIEKRAEKTFDCIAFKRKVQAEIYEDIKDLSPAEEIEYFRKKAETGPLGKWWKSKKVADRDNV